MNYRSVIIIGKASLVDDKELDDITSLSEHILPGRWDDVRREAQTNANRAT